MSNKVFRFDIYFDNNSNDIQSRYVVANNSDEAFDKIYSYRDKLVSKGFDMFYVISEPIVEIDCVI